MLTRYHAKYFAHELTRKRPAADIDRLSMSLFDASVDLNPHQIEAAMFALKSPLSKGVILADEVGLGKTIEAGLVLCQYWAEHKRRLLVVCPASLRKQWSLELEEKFNLSTLILDAPTYKELQRDGVPQPFFSARIVITSIHFASAMQGEVRSIPWDLVVIDEAHKLRNAYRASNRMGHRPRFSPSNRWLRRWKRQCFPFCEKGVSSQHLNPSPHRNPGPRSGISDLPPVQLVEGRFDEPDLYALTPRIDLRHESGGGV